MQRGFTLLELMTVIVVIGILITMLVPTFRALQAKAERANCAANLRSLYVGATSYLQQHQHWPQIATTDIRKPSYAKAWVAALRPYGLSEKNWVCPTIQRELREPDLTKPGQERIDYMATPFDDNPRTPHKYPTHPWFAERGNMHGEGNLVIFANGQVKSLNDVLKDPAYRSVQPF